MQRLDQIKSLSESDLNVDSSVVSSAVGDSGSLHSVTPDFKTVCLCDCCPAADQAFRLRLLFVATVPVAAPQPSETCMHEAHRSIKSSGLLFNNAV